MQRHVLDKPKPRDEAIRMREFLRLARAAGDHPSPRALHRRPKDERSEARLRAFTRIERGRTA